MGYLINSADYACGLSGILSNKENQVFTSVFYKWHPEINGLDMRKPHS
jgi:hypothetical protein